MTTAASFTRVPEPIQVSRVGNGAVSYRQRIGNRTYEFRMEPRCKVCQADEELLRRIHTLAYSRATVTGIMRAVGPEPPFSLESLKNHLYKHTPDFQLFDAAAQQVATVMGLVESQMDRIHGPVAAQAILNRGFDNVVSDRVEVKPSDILAAAKFLDDIEQRDKGQGSARFYGEMIALMVAGFRKGMTDERFASTMWSLRSNPRMIEIARELGMVPVIEAETVAYVPEALPPAIDEDEVDDAPIAHSELIKFL